MKIEPAKIQVRFSDIDIMGHVNNAVYLSYFENARMHYLKSMVGSDWDWNTNGIILLKNEIEYIKPVHLYDSVEIQVLVKSIGNKSFTLEHLLTVNHVLCCKCSSVLVGYNNKSKKSTVINPVMRSYLEKLH